jgi:hypothetical protein
MKFDLFNIVVIIFMVYVIYRLPSVEKMSNIDKATEDKIREIYKIDTDAIRNLSNLARDLTVNGKLIVPGGLDIKGDFKVEGNSEVLKQTTIHELYGGKSTWGGWRNIVVNGGHLMFDVGNKGYGMHSNDNALHFKVNNAWKPLHIFGGIATNEDLHMKGGKSIRSDGRLHIHPQERLYLLAKGNTYITKDWGGDGNVDITGQLRVHGVSHFKNQTKDVWSHINWSDGNVYLRGNVNIDGAGGTGSNVNGAPNVLKNNERITLRSNRSNRRLQDSDTNARFQNHNQGAWEQMFVEKI